MRNKTLAGSLVAAGALALAAGVIALAPGAVVFASSSDWPMYGQSYSNMH